MAHSLSTAQQKLLAHIAEHPDPDGTPVSLRLHAAIRALERRGLITTQRYLPYRGAPRERLRAHLTASGRARLGAHAPSGPAPGGAENA